MSKNNPSIINFDELPDAPNPSANIINFDELPDAPSTKIYDEEMGRGIEVPQGMDDIETNYRISKDVKKIPAQKHLAATAIDDTNDSSFFVDAFNFTKRLANGDFLSQIAKGAESSIKAVPQLFGSYLKQIAADPNQGARNALAGKGVSDLELMIDYPKEANPELDKVANDIITKNQERLVSAGLVPPENDKTGKFFFDIGSSAPNLITALGVTAITKNPLPASALFAEMQKDQVYLEARQKGLSHDEAMATAIPAGLAEGGLELIGLDRFFKVGKADKFISKVVKRSLVEGVQESSQQVAEDVITDIGGVRDTTKREKFDNAMYSGLLGLVLGAPAAVVTSSLEKKIPQGSGITPEEISKGVEALEKEGAVQRMRSLITKETDQFLADPEMESKITQDLKEATKEVSPEQNLAKSLSNIQGSRRDAALTDTTNETQNNIDSVVLEGRLKKLDDNISTIDKQIDAVTQLIENKQNNNQATARDEQKLNTLVNRRDSFDEERANILTTQTPRSTETLTLGDKTANIEVKSGALSLAEDSNVTLKGSKLQNIGQTAIRDINKSFREGRSLAKKDVTEAQNFITTVIDQSALAPTDKAKFIRTIKNIQDAEGLTKKLPEIQSRISNLVEAASRRQLKSDIKAALSKTKTKKQSGKPVGKFDAETQVVLDRLRAASKMSVDAAKAKLESIEQKIMEDSKNGKFPSYEEALENSILSSIADKDNLSISDLEKLKEDISGLIAGGKEARRNELMAKATEVAEIQDGINELVTKGENLQLKDKTFTKSIIEALSDVNNSFMNYDWNNILDIILPPSKANPNLKSSIIEKMSITKLVQKEKGIVRTWSEEFNNEAKAAFGLTKDADLTEKFYQDSREKIIGNFINSAGKEVRLKYSKAQARKFYMEYQDESLQELILSDKGMAYTPEMVDSIINQLDKKDIIFAKKQLELYRKFYPQVQAVYARIHGTYLPDRPNYSPTAREIDKDFDIFRNEFMEEVAFRASIESGSFVSRVKNFNALKKQSDVAVFQRHTVEMAHFISMGERLQQIQQVFGDKNLRDNLKAAYGDGMVELIDETINSVAKNGAIKSNSLDRVINGLNRTFAMSKLGGKIALAPKQLTSALAYWEDMSVKDFVAGLIDFAKNPKLAIETLNKSELVKARGIPEVDLARLGKTTEAQEKFGQLFRKTKKLQDLLLLPTKFGDKGAILVGGWAYYKNQIKQGKSHQQALEAFEEITARTQQSTDVDRLGRMQRGNAFMRGLSMFLTSPNAFLKQEVTAIRKFKRGEITGKELGKKVFLYHFALPAVFQFVANGIFNLDEEDQLSAIVTGPLTGYFFLGEVISNAIRSLVTDDNFRISPLKALMGFEEVFNGIADAAENFGDTEEMLDASVEIMAGVGTLTGLPVDQIKNTAQGIEDISDSKPVRGTERIFGYSKKSVEEIDN